MSSGSGEIAWNAGTTLSPPQAIDAACSACS